MADDNLDDIVGSAQPEPRPAVLGEDCPVTPLGHFDGAYFFSDPDGQFRRFTSRQLTPNGLLDLFGGAKWLTDNFKVVNPKPGAPTWNQINVVDALMRACRDEGMFDPSAMRGPGVWPSDDGAGLIVHCGDSISEIHFKGDQAVMQAYHAGLRLGDFVYPASPPLPVPDYAHPASPDVGEEVLRFLGRWNWADPDVHPVLVFGWAMASFLIGALKHRPILWVVGDFGWGKSELFQLFLLFHGEGAAYLYDNTTAAWLRKLFGDSHKAGAVMIDEAESKVEGGRLKELIELFRACYGRAGSSGRAGADAGDKRVNGMFAAGAILPPPLDPQDASRSATVVLKPLSLDYDIPRSMPIEERNEIVARRRTAFEAEVKEIGALGPALRARMIKHWSRFAATKSIYQRALGERGHEPRVCDTYGTLLTAGYLATSDKPIDIETARRDCSLLTRQKITGAGELRREHELFFQYLLTATPDQWKSGGQPTVGEMLHKALDKRDGGLARLDLRRIGINVLFDKAGKAWGVVVADKHQGLTRVLRGTKWEAGNWRELLLRFEGAKPSSEWGGDGRMRFGPGVREHAVILLPDVVPMAGDDELVPEPGEGQS